MAWATDKFTRRQMGCHIGGLALLGLPSLAHAQEVDLEQALLDQLFGSVDDHLAGLALIQARGEPDMAAGLIFALRFSEYRRHEIVRALEAITGQSHGANWFEWMLWQEARPEIVPHPSLARFMREVFLRVDPNFEVFLRPEHLAREAMRIRLEEISWGGVRKDGIPSLDNPDMLAAGDADYLRDDDLVFGVSINGDARAYPLRIMGWHEMFNDVIGGVPVALAYCTLCGSGILFETAIEGRAAPLIFGSSGFLYRSNKLMFDRETHSLWNQFTGKPVSGALAAEGVELKQRPVVITSWAAWRAANPETVVLSEETGHRRDYGSGVVYANYFGSPDLMFPAQVNQSVHAQKDYVFAIRQFGAARAWPLKAFGQAAVINDAIAETPLVLIGDPSVRSVRAYERGGRVFEVSGAGVVDADGMIWAVTEDALIADSGERLPRVAGHIAYWFAWDNYLSGVATVYDG
jgi:hypothetical protein